MPERDREREAEAYSNPLPPEQSTQHDESFEDDDHHLTNEDFRKLLMTPRAPASLSKPTPSKPVPNRPSLLEEEEDEGNEDDPALRRKKKKSYYAKLMKMKEQEAQELAQRYRDRAKERREGSNKDYEQTEIISTTADYRAVAPDAKAGENYAERRKQLIQESKYLGGDMEHTHLVKGLDYALLEKVRAEITYKEKEEEELEKVMIAPKPTAKKPEKEEDTEPEMVFRTRLGKNIYRTVFKSRHPERNELFLPGRMAYVVDLEDEFADSDVPTTTIRSKADCPSLEATTTLTTNDIVINKLTQILSYLRQGRRENKKLKKKEKAAGKLKEEAKARGKLPGADDGIYADIGDYNPSSSKSGDRKDRRDRDHDRSHGRDRDSHRDRGHGRERDRRDRDYDRDRERGRDRGRERGREMDRGERGDRERKERRSYFEKPVEEDEEKDKMLSSAKDLVRNINDRFRGYAEMEEEKERQNAKKEEDRLKKLKARTEIDSYAECYPGMMESADAIDDSDDEVDYTKMDQGNKKGPIGRWDFDTQEEYSDYMSNKEALPKAAFQYGVKMADGRKTRRTGPKDEKAELDRQWQKIQKIIEKRKYGEGPTEPKRPKY